MLSVTNKGETCSNNLCQHPQCWQTKVRLVRQAVLRRNGIKNKKKRHEQQQSLPVFANEERPKSLPTLKIVDVTRQLVSSSDDDSDDGYESRQHSHQQMLSTSRRSQNRNHTPSSYSTHGPNPTPVSMSSAEHKKECKEFNKKPSCASTKDTDKRKLNKINFHEVYDHNEIYGDWNNTFVSTAYLVWCPSTKKKKKVENAGSAFENQANGFKNIIDEVLPIPRTDSPRKRIHKYPTGGQPYTPCRSPQTRQDWYKPVDYFSDGDYIMTVATENVPPSLVTSKKVLEVKENPKKKDVQFLEDSNSTRVLVDISAHLSHSEILSSNKMESEDKVDEKETKVTTSAVVEELCRDTSGQSSGDTNEKFSQRRAMRLPSVGIPWDLLPKSPKTKHCRNSIPHDKDLGVIMEPVVYLPRTGPNKEHTDSTMEATDETLLTQDSMDVLKSSDQFDERDHLTSAYRFSPTNVYAPAPTPNTPQMRQRSLKSLLRKQAEKASRTMLVDRSLDTIDQESNKEKILPEHVRSHERILQDVHEVNRLVIDHDTEQVSHAVSGGERSRVKLGKFISEKHAYDLDTSFSVRAVSPSSRTNIPPDIWAELQANVVDDVKPRITRGYRNSLAVSGYTYDESAFWKTSGTRLPKSFNSHRCSLRVSSQNILPKMPASLTIVPVPSIRKGKARPATTQRRHTYAESSTTRVVNVDGIKIPVVPIASPVPTEMTEHPVMGVAHDEEYIVARDVVSPNEGQVDTTLEKASYENILFHLTTTNESETFSSEATDPVVTWDEQKECEPQTSSENNQMVVAPERSYAIIVSSDGGIADSGNTGISLESDVMVQVSDDTTHSMENVIHSTDEIIPSTEEIIPSTEEIIPSTEEIIPSTEEITPSTDEITPSTDKTSGLHLRQADDHKIVSSDTSENPVEPTITTDISTSQRDSTTISDHDTSKPAGSNQTSGDASRSTDTSIGGNQLTVNPNLSSGTSGSLIGTSSESMLAKIPSDAPLEAFSIESNLLLPVPIESDLLLLTDSFLDLSFADDNLSDSAHNIDDG